MGTSSRASCPRWPSLRGNSWPMITLFSSQGDFCATAVEGIAAHTVHALHSCLQQDLYKQITYSLCHVHAFLKHQCWSCLSLTCNLFILLAANFKLRHCPPVS